jgi:hypothetical protein
MKVTIISLFDTYEKRTHMFYNYYLKQHNDVTIITSNFSHRYKKAIVDENTLNVIYLPTLKYLKNLSIFRIFSHFFFSLSLVFQPLLYSSDRLIFLIPSNSFLIPIFFVRFFKSTTYIHSDLLDLWPESLLNKSFQTFIPFYIWKFARNQSLRLSDLVSLECNLFRKYIPNKVSKKSHLLYFSDYGINNTNSKDNTNLNELNLLYLGSVNHLLDIDLLVQCLTYLSKRKKISLHIIGGGESLDLMVQRLLGLNLTLINHGFVFDDTKKLDIMQKIDFGLNIMKSKSLVGLSMKSVDYFKFKVPLINNIKYDTEEIINRHGGGFNITDLTRLNSTLDKILEQNSDDLLRLKNQAYFIFETFFSINIFENKLSQISKY